MLVKNPSVHDATAGRTVVPAFSIFFQIISRHQEKTHVINSDFQNTLFSTSFQLETLLATTLFCLLLLGQILHGFFVWWMHLSMLLPLVINFRCWFLSHTCGTSQCTIFTEFPSDRVAVSSSRNDNRLVECDLPLLQAPLLWPSQSVAFQVFSHNIF